VASPSPFERLGLPLRYDLSTNEIEKAYRELQRALHPDKFAQAPASERRAALSAAIEVNEAYRVLKDELSRATALLKALGAETGDAKAPADPAFLMEVMELREELSEARTKKNTPVVEALASRIEAERADVSGALSSAFARLVAGESSEAERITPLLGRLRYYRRFLDEVADTRDELEG
jgi:molecular chaperone HscB